MGGEIAAPATAFDGCWPYTSLLAAAAEIVKEPLFVDVNPLELAVKV